MENPNKNVYQNSNMPSLTTLMAHLKERPFQIKIVLALLTILSQNIIWWTYPLIYSQHLNGHLPAGSIVMVGYTLLISLALHLVFSTKFHSFKAILISVFSGLITFTSLIKGRFEIFCLLLLFTIYIILIQIKWFRLKSVIGLIGMSVIASFTIPLTIFYLQNNYVTNKFILTLIPLLFSYLYFLTPLFLPEGKLRFFTSLLFGLALLVNILLLPLNLWTIVAIAIVIIAWLIIFNLNLKPSAHTSLCLSLQTITVLLIFLQQH